MHFDRIDHVALNVKSLAVSFNWYKALLDVELIHEWDGVKMIGLGDVRIGLFEAPDAEPVPELEKKLAILHFALICEGSQFEDIQKYLKEKGIRFTGPEDIDIANSIFVRDPDGNEIEFIAYKDAKFAGKTTCLSISANK